MSSLFPPHHLDTSACRIGSSPGKGRGVFASQAIRQGTLIEISPVLFFSKDEYEKQYAVLDHYTFQWKDGRIALALGLGSLFNHSNKPNVSYTLDSDTESISYHTAHDVEPNEELLIFYDHELWFEQAEPTNASLSSPSEVDDGWGGLSVIDEEQPKTESLRNPFLCGDSDAIVEDELLPFTRIKPPPEEETLESIRTVPAWVVEIPDQRHITTLLTWLKKTGLDGPELGHLKRIRKQGDRATLLLSLSPIPPALPDDIMLPETYQIPVPISPALTSASLEWKSSFWPTHYTPRRKGEPESWTRGKCNWAWEAMGRAVSEARRALVDGELPVAAYVPPTFHEEDGAFIGRDTRTSTQHPLRHAVLNLVRALADNQGVQKSSPQTPVEGVATPGSRNGSNYLLNSRTIFLTHEPCVMCSMALLHSRVKEVFYLLPMRTTGGCGGLVCLPTLQGVNHRFEIFRWTLRGVNTRGLVINGNTDA
ncbi:hypothetical protein E1B28_012536 [Marasmius oreades]|uniref:SET domain-containing protein n=1 Tax=Marasmius oreades TaxID=181124 RepID=A0A9P7RRS5_9AGAR|nr:uncharacterized protein E1B28_012536 [Marasmius oreades]KAG7088554.1 hypothetical protein E1B28_012536 [Marasmius oreades]